MHKQTFFYHGKTSKAAVVTSQLVSMMMMVRNRWLAKPSCQRDYLSETKPSKPKPKQSKLPKLPKLPKPPQVPKLHKLPHLPKP